MNKELFESLLYEGEGTTLDFKAQQYRFAKATDEDKSELLKDILGFTNTWRRANAYILIGVEEMPGARANVVGISEHLDDHSLQQFVNNLTNQPLRFHYTAFGFEGKQVGIISIEEQTRPVYLKREYGKLQKEKVYIRRGSSTDPTKPASPEEIAQMRVVAVQAAAELIVEFAEMNSDNSCGPKITRDAEFCEMPETAKIPEFEGEERVSIGSFGPNLQAYITDPMYRTNKNFYRDMAAHEFVRRLFRPVRLLITNVGQIATRGVRAELIIPVANGVMPMIESKVPEMPKRSEYVLKTPALEGIRPIIRHPGAVHIDQNQERFKLEIECGDLQPGRTIWSEVFYIGKAKDGEVLLNGLIYSDHLPRPKEFSLSISGEVRRSKLTAKELVDLADQINE
jgi:hypothetical protein